MTAYRFPMRALLLMLCSVSFAPAKAETTLDEQCLLNLLANADADTRVGTLRAQCDTGRVETPDQVSTPAQDREVADRFKLIPYQSNYLLPVTYTSNPESGLDNLDDDELDNEEVKFQFSLKVPVATDITPLNADIYFGYTQLSLWQAYNTDYSSPFRETNYEPEVFVSVKRGVPLPGFENTENRLGMVHQSNGRGGNLSRSWNRLYLQLLFRRGNFNWSIKPWWRIPESEKDDDNPDIETYLGYFEWRGLYHWNQQNFSMMVRNNLRSDNRGAVELGWSYPINDYLRIYLQYFNGYGESLINYNNHTDRLGIGFELTNWL